MWNGPKGVLNQHIYKVFANENVHGHWLYLALLHITQKIEAQAHGFKSTLLHVQKKDIDNQFVLTPPVAEQKKIAQILSTWDNAISVTEKLLTNSQQQKKALMQQLLTGKKRLLDENGVRFSGEWKRVKLGAIADMNSGGTPKSTVEEYYGGNIPWVSISDMTSNGKWIATTEKYLTELGLNSSSARIYPKNSVLYAMYASIGECSIAAVNLTSSQAILGIRPKDCLNYEFLYFYLTSLKEKIKLQGQQGTQSNLNAGMVKEFELDLPSIREQQKIAAVLSVADAEISTLEKKLACLKDEKKALMQQLLTGKRRVKVDEAVAV
ncbi:restriction endonuclease subunit S [Escherichia coli]|uniref:restriction endonuclease subunit S n=1 Tax=Escherichia coli TaxID=562 RepID=UPI00201F140A|nr:restriction endonuclease subunit S [Escherichia coli]